jgi:hypothetical protein
LKKLRYDAALETRLDFVNWPPTSHTAATVSNTPATQILEPKVSGNELQPATKKPQQHGRDHAFYMVAYAVQLQMFLMKSEICACEAYVHLMVMIPKHLPYDWLYCQVFLVFSHSQHI